MSATKEAKKKLMTENAHIKTLFGRTAVMLVQRECNDGEVPQVKHEREAESVGFNNNIYNNC